LMCFCVVVPFYSCLIGKDALGVCGVAQGRCNRRIG
jgi:hypothetical protein